MPVYAPGGGGEDPRKKKKKRGGSDGGGTSEPVGHEQWYEDAAEAGFDAWARQQGMSPNELEDLIQSQTSEYDFDNQYAKFTQDLYLQTGSYSDLMDPEAAGLLWESWLQGKKFDLWNKTWPTQVGPETILAGTQLPQLASHATAFALETLMRVYGPEYAVAALSTSLIDDPAQREKTWEIIETIAGKTMPIAPESGGNIYGKGGVIPVSSVAKGADVHSIVTRLLTDPNAFEKMNSLEQRIAVQVAQGAVDVRASVDAEVAQKGLANDVGTARNIFLRNKGWELVLSDDEVTQLEALIEFLPRDKKSGDLSNQGVISGDVAVMENALGLTHYEEPGGHPTYVFDPEWVRNHFDKYAGIMEYLRRKAAEDGKTAQFRMGQDGAVIQVFGLLDKSTDEIASWVGAGLGTVKESVEGLFVSGEDRARYKVAADEQMRAIKEGRVAPGELDKAVSRYYELLDRGMDDTGVEGFARMQQRFADPAVVGTGFGDAMTFNLGMYPGDKGYDFAHSVFTMVGQIAFDPTILGAKVIKPLTLARVVPAGAKVSKSFTTQLLFDVVSKPPEVFWSSKSGGKIISKIVDIGKQFDDPMAFATRIHDRLGVDRETAEFIANGASAGEETLRARLLQTMVGASGKGVREAEATAKIDDAVLGLNMIDTELPRQIKNLRAKITRRLRAAKGQPGRIPFNRQFGGGGRYEADLPVSLLRNQDALDDTFGVQWRKRDSITGGTPVRTQDELDATKASLAADGQREPIMVEVTPNGDLTIIDGTHRAMLAEELGWDTVRVSFATTGLENAERTYRFLERVHPEALLSQPRKVRLTGQMLDRTGRSIGDLGPEDYVWVRTEDLKANVDQQLPRTGVDTPQPGYDTSLVEEIREHGYPKPIEVMYDPEVGTFEITDGNHALAAAIELGDEWVPVRTVSAPPGSMSLQQRVNFVPPTHGQSLNQIDPKKFRGWIEDDSELRALQSELEDLEDLLAQGRAERSDLVTQKLFWEDARRGADFEPVIPLREYPKMRSLRGLSPSKSGFGKVWSEMIDATSALPLDQFRNMDVSSFTRWIAQHPKANRAALRAMQAFRRWGKNTGLGERLWFETSVLPEGLLADEAIDQSYRRLRDFGRYIGTPEATIDDVLTRMATASRKGNRVQLYDAFVNGYQDMVRYSSRLDDVGKRSFADMWPEMLGERAAAFVKKTTGKTVKSEPTLWVPLVDDAGKYGKAGVPIFEADMLRGFTLPNFRAVRDYVSTTRQFLRGVGEASKTGKRIENTYFTMSQWWRSFNAAWAQAVLMGRMPLALPGRIQLEQAVRIEAMGFSSMVRHPVEWFKSLKGWDEFAQFGDSPAYALGTVTANYWDDFGMRQIRRGRQTVNIKTDPEATMRALAGRIRAYSSSPSVNRFWLTKNVKKMSNKKAAEAFQETSHWHTFKPLWDDIIDAHKATGGPLTSYDKIVGEVRRELKQVIGTGPGAAKVEQAIASGRMTIDGKTIAMTDKKYLDLREGKLQADDANLFADEMKRMYDEGEWVPDVWEFPRSWGDYLPPGDVTVLSNLRKFRDWAFRSFYSRPDLYFGRSPLFRQVAAREFDRLRSLGWSEKGAKTAATTYGARKTADMLFTIGANSSADYFLRAAMPFFPAWKELAQTWLSKVPHAVGGRGMIGWGAGMSSMVRRTDAYLGFLMDNEIVTNDNGIWKVKIGFLAPIARLAGIEMDTVKFSAESVASLLPTPSLSEGDPFWKGMLPTLGAPSGAALHLMNDRWGGVFEDLEENLTLFGGNQSLGPASLDYVLQGMGLPSPWMSGQSEEMYSMRKEWAFIDAFRVAYDENYDKRPLRGDFGKGESGTKAYTRAQAEWLEDLYAQAERQTTRWYLGRGISSVLLPFSIKYENDAVKETSAMWAVINEIQNEADAADLTSALLGGFRDAHPELGLYLTGKTQNLVPDDPDDDNSYESFEREILEGTRVGFTEKEWMVWALGSQEAALHRSRMKDIYDRFGQTPQQYLLAGYEVDQLRREEENRWETYLLSTEMLADVLDVRDETGRRSSFASMYENFNEERAKQYPGGKKYSLDIEQEKASEALDALGQLAEFFGATQVTDMNYSALKAKLNEIADFSFQSKDPFFRATSWWWDKIEPYFTEKARVWDQINETPTGRRAPLYRELVEIENRWANKEITHDKWGDFPQVQKVIHNKLSPYGRKVKEFGWARLPVEFLSEFQRQQVYGKSKKDPELNKLAAVMGENREWFEKIVDQNAISPSSNDYEALENRMDQMNLAAARELGVQAEYERWQRPAYLNVSALVHDPLWDQVVAKVDSGRRTLEAHDVSPRGSTEAAVHYQRSIVAMVEDFRRRDPNFNKLMEQLETAYGDGPDRKAVGVDMYWPLFFNGWGSAPGYLLY